MNTIQASREGDGPTHRYGDPVKIYQGLRPAEINNRYARVIDSGSVAGMTVGSEAGMTISWGRNNGWLAKPNGVLLDSHNDVQFNYFLEQTI